MLTACRFRPSPGGRTAGHFFSRLRALAPGWCLTTLAALPLLLVLPAGASAAQSSATEYRAFWVDTFNTPLNNHGDVLAVINNAKATRANAIFAQMRRRGDSWYLNSIEPPGDRTPIESGFDPLQDLIVEAHANDIEVHAFVVVLALWGRSPVLFPPTDSRHVFNLHGGFDAATGTIVAGPDNWLTRTLLPDGGTAVAFQGHRFGSDFWMEPGHPDAAAYTVSVLTHLVRNYDIDGLHLDRIRYPEISVAGQTPASGANIGYNETNVARFRRHYGIEANSPPPAPNDASWSQWRRDQVTNLVRRIYLNAIAIKPRLKVSAALIAFGNGPATEDVWNLSEPYWRVYQDWRAWTEEGILDIAVPMIYKTEHTSAGRAAYDQWVEWSKNHQYNRAAVIGQGAFVNSVEGTLRQVRRALATSAAGNNALGVNFFSMATSNAAVAANPLSIPPGQNTPARPFAEFASGLTTGKSVDESQLYEDSTFNPTPVFAESAAVPELAWKTAPALGHVMGFAMRADGSGLDTADVQLVSVDDGSVRTTKTDGGGFYGAVDLEPGLYRAVVRLGDELLSSCVFEVSPGRVATADASSESAADVTGLLEETRGGFRYERATNQFVQVITLRNSGADAVTGRLSLVLDELSGNASLAGADGRTACAVPLGSPFVDVNVGDDGEFGPGETATVVLRFDNPTRAGITYSTRVVAGNRR